MMDEMEWPDMNLYKEMREGFKLVGSFETTGIFKTDVTVVHLSEVDLKTFLRPAILGRLTNYEDEELQKQLFSVTLEEAADKQWLDGPYKVEDIPKVRNFAEWKIAAH